MKIYQVDAFTSKIFSGNPAGVSLVDEFPSTELMQNIAREMNLSETAFVKHQEKNKYQIRFFTPASEVDLCGHATLSSAHILLSTGIVPENTEIEFHAKKDTLKVKKSQEYYVMSFPLWSFSPQSDIQKVQDITEVPGIQEVYDTDTKWKIVLIDSVEILKSLEPNFSQMKGSQYANVVVTCKGDENYDYYMRCFVTGYGINEDPVTGSIECVLAPFWEKRLGKNQFTVAQVSQRGGEKNVKILPNSRVEISGKAVTVFEIEAKI